MGKINKQLESVLTYVAFGIRAVLINSRGPFTWFLFGNLSCAECQPSVLTSGSRAAELRVSAGSGPAQPDAINHCVPLAGK